MQRVKNLPRGQQAVLAGTVLLLADTFLPWQKVSLGAFSYSWTAWHGPKGVLLGLSTVVLLLSALLQASRTTLPRGVPDALPTLALGALVLALTVVKNVRDDYSAWGSYLGIALAVGVSAGAWLTYERTGRSAAVESPPAAEAAVGSDVG